MNRKVFIKHFRVSEFSNEILTLKFWAQGATNHYFSTNQVRDHLELWLYVSGKLTEKFIFDL